MQNYKKLQKKLQKTTKFPNKQEITWIDGEHVDLFEIYINCDKFCNKSKFYGNAE